MANQKTKSVFLFGAGAAIPWGAPSTLELTTLIRNAGFQFSETNEYITEYIFNQLISNGFKETEVNFETILNVIEELIVFNSPFDWLTKTPPLLNPFFKETFSENLYNYSIKDGIAKHGYQLEIPKGKEYPYSEYAYHNQLPHQFYLQHLLRQLLSEICVKISHYTYPSPKKLLESLHLPISQNFIKWMQAIEHKSHLRMYSLNYDNIYEVLLSDAGIPVFNGFPHFENPNDDAIRCDVRRILSDFDSNVFYNLHGSVFWNVEMFDKEQLPNPEVFLRKYPQMYWKHDIPFAQIEKGKTILVSNIITGYQKAQRTAITPFKQMQASFDKDCCFAETLYLIGYSLGDEHINESIKTAIRHNPAVKIIIIDKNFLKGMDFTCALKIMPFHNENRQMPRTIESGFSHILMDGKLVAYSTSFEDYLQLYTDISQKHRVNI